MDTPLSKISSPFQNERHFIFESSQKAVNNADRFFDLKR